MSTAKHRKKQARAAHRHKKARGLSMPETKKRNDAADPSLKTIFNRVVSHPEKLDGQPYLINTDIPVSDVIDFLAEGHEDQRIQQQFNGLSQSGLDACRAYQARFHPETIGTNPPLDPDNKMFFLDENISYLLLYDVARLFGYSSHAGAENMSGHGPNHDDEKDIWAHVLAEKYKAVLTADCDFIDIAERHKERIEEQYGSLRNSPEKSPVVIHVKPGTPAPHLLRLLQKHQEEIRDFTAQDSHICGYLIEKGLRLDQPEKLRKCAERKAQGQGQGQRQQSSARSPTLR